LRRTGMYLSFLAAVALAAPAQNAARQDVTAMAAPAQVQAQAPRPVRDGAKPPQGAARSGTLQLEQLFVGYYGADPAELERRADWISEYDLAVALHLVRRSRTDIDRIVAWRREGNSWDDITRKCALGGGVYHVTLPGSVDLPEPYSRPYQRWRALPGTDQRLTDEEVRELVILRALSDYCGIAADQVVRLRMAGQSPRAILSQHPPRKR